MLSVYAFPSEVYGSIKAWISKTLHKGPIKGQIFTQNYLKSCMSSGESGGDGKIDSAVVGKKKRTVTS